MQPNVSSKAVGPLWATPLKKNFFLASPHIKKKTTARVTSEKL